MDLKHLLQTLWRWVRCPQRSCKAGQSTKKTDSILGRSAHNVQPISVCVSATAIKTTTKNMLNEYNLKWNLLDPVLDFTVTQPL